MFQFFCLKCPYNRQSGTCFQICPADGANTLSQKADQRTRRFGFRRKKNYWVKLSLIQIIVKNWYATSKNAFKKLKKRLRTPYFSKSRCFVVRWEPNLHASIHVTLAWLNNKFDNKTRTKISQTAMLKAYQHHHLERRAMRMKRLKTHTNTPYEKYGKAPHKKTRFCGITQRAVKTIIKLE